MTECTKHLVMTKNNRLKLGFGQVSNTVLRDPELSLGEKALYSYLATYADANNELFVGGNKMANECGVGRSTIQRHLLSLEKKGIIKRMFRRHMSSKVIILLK